MHLAKIDIYGFKSFGQEVHIELPPGVTGLVGPNGGGKSNVVDAIRWALGEQRVRELRAERWEDLLFTGNNRRTASRLAEVSLHFDNQDGTMSSWPESLTVTRRLYRHGESEYVINGRSVRLRDVMDLFLDSGIGRFNYAIISQGRVESALMQKPKERLEQVEEAAGVSRYKVRKVQTVSHLKEVETNLARLDDLQQETGRQMDEVRSAADRERQYLEWQSLRSEWQDRLRVTEYQRDQAQLRELKNHEQQGTATISAVNIEIEKIESHIQEQKAQEQEMASTMEAQDQRLRGTEQESWQLDQEMATHRLGLDAANREEARLRGELAEIEQQQGLLDQEAQLTDVSVLLDEERRLQEEQRTLEEQERARREMLAGVEIQKSRHEQQIFELTARQAELDRLLSRWQGAMGVNSIAELGAARQQRQAEALRLEQEVKHLNQELEGLVEQRTHLRQRNTQEEKDLTPLRHRRSQREARLRALRQLELEGDGLPGGVRAVLKAYHEDRLKGIQGTLGALIQSDSEVMLAIQIGLGGSANDIVVTTEADARKAVKFLQSNALGRATFLPLDTIRPGMPSAGDKVLDEQAGVLGWALDLVRYEKSMQAAVSHVLGRVLVLSTLDDAMRLGPVHRFRYKMVTLDGQLVHAGGAITGGHHSQRDSRYLRRMEIETLAQQLKEDSSQIGVRETDLKAHQNELARLEPTIEETRDRLGETRQKWTVARQTESQQLDLEDPGVLEREFQELKQVISAEESQRDQVEAIRAEQIMELGRLQMAVSEHKEHLRDVSANRRQQEILVERMNQERHRNQTHHERLGQRLNEVGRSAQEHTEELQRLTAQRETQVHAVELRRREQSETRKMWERLKQEGLDAENRLRALQHEERRLSNKLAQAQQAIFRIEHQWETYVPKADLLPLSSADESIGRDKVRRLDELMGDMGEIVPGKLMLFEQLGERHGYLQNQMGDIESARQDLLQTLAELDQEVNRRVEVTVSRIEKSFADACRILYSGGEGGIRFVTDGERGIDLWVKPPGKRSTHLSLLSGGEKALGGIAWLFALLAVRPSPFVILDEVEASLDEANAARFAEYLDEFRRTAQCVIVTHHKETMAVADALWGVAGDGQGQSRLISVMLEEALAP